MDLKQVLAGDPGTRTQNLINQSNVNPTERRPGFFKAIALDVLSVLSALLFGYTYYSYLAHNLSLWWLFTALTLFGVFTTLQVFLAIRFTRRFGVMICETIALLGFFYRDNIRILLLTAAVFLVLSLWGYLSSRTALANSIEIQFFRITSNVLGKFTTGALIFMILIYVPQFDQNSVFVSRQSFRQFFNWSAGMFSNIYPNISLNSSFQMFAESVAKMELENNANFQAMSPQAQSTTIEMAATQFTTNFASSTPAGPVSSTAPASDAFYDFIVGMLSAWQSQGPTWFLVGWAVVLFLSLRTIGIAFVWFGQFISLIFYEILLASGFMKITEATQTKEVIGY